MNEFQQLLVMLANSRKTFDTGTNEVTITPDEGGGTIVIKFDATGQRIQTIKNVQQS